MYFCHLVFFISEKEKKNAYKQQKGFAIYDDDIVADVLSESGSLGPGLEILMLETLIITISKRWLKYSTTNGMEYRRDTAHILYECFYSLKTHGYINRYDAKIFCSNLTKIIFEKYDNRQWKMNSLKQCEMKKVLAQTKRGNVNYSTCI